MSLLDRMTKGAKKMLFKVFKTLVTQGKSGAYYVFVVPVKEELDLKKAAKAAVICFFIPSSLFLLTVLLLRYASAQASFGWFYYSKNRPIWACFQSSK